MTDDKVRVVADKFGNVVNVCSNPEYGYIRVQQEVEIPIKSWINRKTIYANVFDTMEALLEKKYHKNTVLPGKIVIKESHEPFDLENPDRDLKYAGKTGVPCHVYGEPIYRKTFYTEDMNDDHVFIKHTNQDEIKAAMAAGIVVENPNKTGWQKQGTL